MKKKYLLLILILVLCLVGCGKKEEKKEEAKEKGPYRLVKYADAEQSATQPLTIASKGDYLFLTTYNRLNGIHEFIVYKNGKLVASQNVDARMIRDDRYYSFAEKNYYLIDYDNMGIDDTKYTEFGPFDNGIIVSMDGKQGVIDYNGKVIVDFDYDDLEYQSDEGVEYLLAQKGKKVGVIDLKGNEVIPFEYDIYYQEYIREYDYNAKSLGVILNDGNGTAFILKKDNVDYLLDTNGKVLLEAKKIEFFYGNSITDKKKIYSYDGKEIETLNIDDESVSTADYFIEGNIVKRGKDLVYVSKNFKMSYILSSVYSTAIEGPDGKYNEYYVNDDIYFKKVDKKVIELRTIKDNKLLGTYDKVEYTRIDRSDKCGVHCSKNNNFEYYYVVCKDSKCGLVDSEGKEVLPLEYKYEASDWFGTVILSKDNEYNIITDDGIGKYTCSEGNKISGDISRDGKQEAGKAEIA